MIKIDDYSLVAFVSWLKKRKYSPQGEAFEGGLNYETEQLVEEYLQESYTKWNLTFFLKLFQDYAIISFNRDQDTTHLMSSFMSSVRNVEMIIPSTLNKRIRLHPTLYRFRRFITIDTMDVINNKFEHISVIARINRLSLEEWFDLVVQECSEILIENYVLYMESGLYGDNIYLFRRWLEEKHDVTLNTHDHYGMFSFENRKGRIISEIKNSPVRIEQDSQVYSDLVCYMMSYSNDDESFIDFLHFLNLRGLRIGKNIPTRVLERYATEFCLENIFVDKRQISKFIKSITKKDDWFSSVLNRIRYRKGNTLDIERIDKMKAHGLLLFHEHNKISSFFNSYWRDIHHLTGDIMDIYYSENDFKVNKSCRETIKKLVHMNIKEKVFPGLIVWEKFGGDVQNIVLKNLTHQEIFDVIECFVNALEESGYKEGVEIAKRKVGHILEGKSPKVVNYDLRYSRNGAVGDGSMSVNTPLIKHDEVKK